MDQQDCSGLRVLVLAPIGQDGPLVCRLLQDRNIPALACAHADELALAIDDKAGAVLLTEEAADDVGLRKLGEAIKIQSPWLDLPILLCVSPSRGGGWPQRLEHLKKLGNVLLLERPIQTAALVSAVQTALRSRQRQRRMKLIADMTKSLLAENDPEKLLDDVWSVLSTHLPVQGYLYHTLSEDNRLQLVSSSDIPAEQVIALQEWEQRQSPQGTDPEELTQAFLQYRMKGTESFSLIAGGRHFGVITFLISNTCGPSPEERALLQTVCDHLALAMRRSQTLQALQDRAEELADHARRKDEFLAMLGHELRNPLAAMTMGLEVLRQSGALSMEFREPLEVIRQEAWHITRLVDDLLDVSRITRGKIELHKEHLNLQTMLTEVFEKCRPQAERRSHRLELQLAPEPCGIEADRTRFRQVIENLITNSIKYTDPGGQILLSTSCSDGYAVIKVRDTGIGMTPEMQQRVFDLFVQDHRALDRSQGGLGIGLTLAQRLVELHGGEIRLHSDGPGHGSEFQVWLPLSEQASLMEAEASSAWKKENVETPLRVLIVEDIPQVGQITQLLLRKLGAEVRLLQRGTEAVQISQSFRPDLILLDIGLPDLDGYQVARQLRDRLGTRCPLLVAVTGYGQSEDRNRAFSSGFDQHLTKPARAEEMIEIMSLARARRTGM